jgi:hypothetical protein
MKYIQKIIILILLFCSTALLSQNNCGYVAGHSCADAPVICDLSCLNGFSGTLLNASETVIQTNLYLQPEVICTNGGNPQNMSWFAFVAGSSYAKITIKGSNCELGKGIQAGLYGDCDFSDDLDLNDFPIASEYLDCEDPPEFSNQPIVLESFVLVKGQTYYFYVDGIGADVCSYKVSVDQADQPNELDNLIEFDQAKGKDTIALCPSTNYTLGVEKYKLEIGYFWKVSPTNSFYPYSNFTKLDTSVLDWKFDSLGTYTISMFAYNGCDATDTVTKTIVVKDYSSEKFKDVFICENSFPYIGPQNEDPNKDGTIGWLGPNILAKGLNVHQVFLATGCTYTQEVNVNINELQLPQSVLTADCNSYSFHGFNVTQNTFNQLITIPNADQNGCDSLISLNAYILDLKGSIEKKSCNSGSVEVAFISSSISSPPGYTLTYIWKDENGNIISDNDTDPTNVIVNKKTQVSLQVTLDVLGKKCSFDISPLNVDPSSQLPVAPSPENWDLELCEGSLIAEYAVLKESGMAYQWSASNGATFVGSNVGDKVKIDFTNVALGSFSQICVEAKNVCGVSPKICFPITILKKPSTKFLFPSIDICKDSIFGITVVENPSYKYNWTFGQALVVSGNTNGQGPIFLKYSTAGTFNIGLTINNKECASDSEILKVNVINGILPSSITYESHADKIIINWTAVPCTKSYNLYINGLLKTNTTNLSYELNGLMSGDILNARIEAIADGICGCGFSNIVEQIKTLDCSNFKLAIDKNISTVICENDWVNPIQLSSSFSASSPIGWNGIGVNSSGLFLPKDLGVGKHKIFAKAEYFGCEFIDSILFDLVKMPDVALATTDPKCEMDEFGSVEVKPSDIQSLLNYFIDGNQVQGPIFDQVSVGNHQIEIIDANSCKVIKSVTINPPLFPEVIVTGADQSIYDNQVVNLTLTDNTSELNLIDSIVWIINGEVFCKGLCRNINFPSMEGGEYSHQILIYYKDCVMEKSLNFTVKESPKIYFSNVINSNASNEVNKFFLITSNDPDLKISEVNIFSKWGDLVFAKKNFNVNEKLWDGTFNGIALLPGVYVVKASYLNEKGIMISTYKDITILK